MPKALPTLVQTPSGHLWLRARLSTSPIAFKNRLIYIGAPGGRHLPCISPEAGQQLSSAGTTWPALPAHGMYALDRRAVGLRLAAKLSARGHAGMYGDAALCVVRGAAIADVRSV